jgi:hypothetical protein
MDDDTLAPFVDALASALIVMVLVSIFFLIQTATSITGAAQLFTVNELKQAPQLSRIVYRDIIKSDLDNNEFTYLVNFELTKEMVNKIKNNIGEVSELTITVESRETDKKNVVNLLRFIKYLALPDNVKINTKFGDTKSMLSKIKWEKI